MKDSPTVKVIGLLLGLLIISALYYLTGVFWGTFLLVILLYEGYTFIDAFPNDTLSEVLAELSRTKPYIIMFLSLCVGYAVGHSWLGPAEAVARGLALGLPLGHWFWRLCLKSDINVE